MALTFEFGGTLTYLVAPFTLDVKTTVTYHTDKSAHHTISTIIYHSISTTGIYDINPTSSTCNTNTST